MNSLGESDAVELSHYRQAERRRERRFRALIRAVLIAALFALLFLPLACAAPQPVPETVRVEIPVVVLKLPPAPLREPFRPAVLPDWFAPSEPGISSCLKPDGEDVLAEVIWNHTSRDRALNAWAIETESENGTE